MNTNQDVNLNLDHFPRIVQEKIGYWLWRRRYDEIRHEYFMEYRAIYECMYQITGIFNYLRKRSNGCLHPWSAYEINGWCQFCGDTIFYEGRYNWRPSNLLPPWPFIDRINSTKYYLPKRYWYSSGLNRTDGFGYKEEYDEWEFLIGLMIKLKNN